MTRRAGRVTVACVVAACVAGGLLFFAASRSSSAGARAVSITPATKRALVVASGVTLANSEIVTPTRNLGPAGVTWIWPAGRVVAREAYLPSSDTFYASVCAQRASTPLSAHTPASMMRGGGLMPFRNPVSRPLCMVLRRTPLHRWASFDGTFFYCSRTAGELRRLWPDLLACASLRPAHPMVPSVAP